MGASSSGSCRREKERRVRVAWNDSLLWVSERVRWNELRGKYQGGCRGGKKDNQSSMIRARAEEMQCGRRGG